MTIMSCGKHRHPDNSHDTSHQSLADDTNGKKHNVEADILEYQKKMTVLARNLVDVEQRVQQRVSTGIHDLIGQPLALAKLRLDDIKTQECCAGIHKDIKLLEELIDEALSHARSMTFELYQPADPDLGLEEILRSLISKFRRIYPIEVTLETAEEGLETSYEINSIVGIACRELLVNTFRHASATRIRIILRELPGQVALEYIDNGGGYKMNPAQGASHSGSIGTGIERVRDRIKALGGELNTISILRIGTAVVIRLPRTLEQEVGR